MIRAALLLLLGSCAAHAPSLAQEASNGCGVKMEASTWLSSDDLKEAVEAAVLVASTTKDKRLSNPSANCDMLRGYVVKVRLTRAWDMWSDDHTFTHRVSGATYCWPKRIEIGEQVKGKGWRSTALIHEFFHAMQDCITPPPADVDQDNDHSNWSRDGIKDAIFQVNGFPD